VLDQVILALYSSFSFFKSHAKQGWRRNNESRMEVEDSYLPRICRIHDFSFSSELLGL